MLLGRLDRISRSLAAPPPGRSIAFSPDGDVLALALKASVQLWHVATESRKQAFDGTARSVAFSPDGKTLASASASGDQKVKLWDIQSGECEHTIDPPTPNL